MKIKIGVSSCLLGNSVRYDRGHKNDSYISKELAERFEFVVICPEVESGLPIPRESMALYARGEDVLLLGNRSRTDFTKMMTTYTKKKCKELAHIDLCGYIFKTKSPSCGLTVPLYNEDRSLHSKRAGLFVAEFQKNFPFIPIIDEGRIYDLEQRETFFTHVIALARFREILSRKKRSELIKFHEQYKMVYLSKDEKIYRTMGTLLGTSAKGSLAVFEKYFELFTEVMRKKSTVAKHINVMMHLIGHFKKDIEAEDKAEFQEILNRFKRGEVPLLVPVTLLNHYARKFQKLYLLDQYYLKL